MEEPRRKVPQFDWIELRGFARSVVEVEWLLVALSLVYVYFADFGDTGPELYIGCVVVFAASILLLRYTPMASRLPRALIALEIGLMMLFVTIVSWQTGGAESPLVNLYLLPLVASALIFGRLITVWLFMALAICLAALLAASRASYAIGGAEIARLFALLAPMTLVVILTTLLAENIRRTRDQLRHISDRDRLTEQFNMQAFSRRLREEHEHATRTGAPYSVVMIDVDDLKRINQQFGHEAGNRAILLVARTIRACTRLEDTLARFGGDQFVLLLPGIDRTVAESVMQRIRNSIFAATLSVGNTMTRLSVSLGAAAFPEDGAEHGDVIRAADRAMYHEKAERARIEASKLPSAFR